MDPRTWVATAQPATLLELGDAWIGVGAELEGLFQEYQMAVTTVDGAYWEGQTANAAQARAQSDYKTMQLLADKLEAIGNRAKQGYEEINAPLLRARGAIMEAERRTYQISEKLALSLQKATDEQAKELTALQTELNDAVRSAMQADITVRDALNVAGVELRVAFVSAAALGSQQARSDGQQLVDDPASLSPEAQQRLIEAGQLTPEQLTALQRGDSSTIPASQMEYLNELSRSMDGKSPKEIEQIVNKLPPETQKAMANSFQIMSNPKINAGPVTANDKELPNSGKGGLAVLPAKMQSSLTRSDLVTKESKYFINEQVNLNGVADNKAIAKLVSAGDPQYMTGTDVDRKLLDVGSKYLAGIQDYKDDSHVTFGGTRLQIDGSGGSSYDVVGDFFTTAGHDKAAVQELLTGEDMLTGGLRTTDEEREQLFENITTFPWDDKGAAPATLFQFNPGDATIENRSDPADVLAAERHGKIMSSAAEFLAGSGDPEKRWGQLTSLESGDRNTLGESQPLLAQSLATGLTPHMENLAGGDSPNTAGFDVPRVLDPKTQEVTTWLDPEGNGTYRGSSNIFSILSTDTTDNGAQSILVNGAGDSIARSMQEYATDPSAPGSSSKLSTIGRLDALVVGGQNAGAQAVAFADHEDATTAHENKSKAIDPLQTLIEEVPFGGYIGAGIEEVKPFMMGDAPELKEPETQTAPNFDRINHAVLARMSITPELQDRYSGLFEDGQLRSWEAIKTAPNGDNLAAQSAELFDSMDRADGNSTAMERAYRQVAESAPRPEKPEEKKEE
ncbi:hypothetical protein ACIBEH_00590 [Nocardia salmonicida]|uniref:TPR repeat region-containing protein n=1 Tax=Nocardia salmonicida TaxID=53431 RepID=UPI003799719B